MLLSRCVRVGILDGGCGSLFSILAVRSGAWVVLGSWFNMSSTLLGETVVNGAFLPGESDAYDFDFDNFLSVILLRLAVVSCVSRDSPRPVDFDCFKAPAAGGSGVLEPPFSRVIDFEARNRLLLPLTVSFRGTVEIFTFPFVEDTLPSVAVVAVGVFALVFAFSLGFVAFLSSLLLLS